MRAVSRRGVTAWELTSAFYQVNCSRDSGLTSSHVNCPSSAAMSTSTATRTISFGFHCNIRTNLPERRPDAAIVSFSWPPAYPPIGGFAANAAYEAEARPASASGRRPHASRFAYEPESAATATPYPDEWMNQPLPR